VPCHLSRPSSPALRPSLLAVDPDFGRHGVASALLASVVAVARQRGLPALTTFASLTSRPVFERHGFVITGERYFGEGDRAAKTYAMRCVLAAPLRLRCCGVIISAPRRDARSGGAR
jgi:GNAT superfamily N-acetyltransferase